MIPVAIVTIKKMADISLMYQFRLKTPYKIAPNPIIKVLMTNQLFIEIEYSVKGLERTIPSSFKSFPSLLSGFLEILFK
jgi:hypothetical protein